MQVFVTVLLLGVHVLDMSFKVFIMLCCLSCVQVMLFVFVLIWLMLMLEK